MPRRPAFGQGEAFGVRDAVSGSGDHHGEVLGQLGGLLVGVPGERRWLLASPKVTLRCAFFAVSGTTDACCLMKVSIFRMFSVTIAMVAARPAKATLRTSRFVAS